MRGFSGGSSVVFAWMRGDLALPEGQGNQSVTGVQLKSLTNVLMRYRVVMLLILHVIVDVDLDRFDIYISVWMLG